MSTSATRTVGVLLVNLGTPDAATPASVRRYLREFLADPRVIEMPRLLWFFILRLFVLPLRPRRVARLYQQIWTPAGSPMRRIHEQLGLKLAACLRQAQADVQVRAVMRYGQPGLMAALNELQAAGIRQLIVLPLFPQYSATTSASVMDAIGVWLQQQRDVPSVVFWRDYHDHPRYLDLLAARIRAFQAEHGRPERLLLSFHGIPQVYAERGDPYPEQCRRTAAGVAARLGVADQDWALSFQSRFGLQEWLKPYTDALLASWAQEGVRDVQVACPAFSADCLETLEEIAQGSREVFLHAGGERYRYIPALNDGDDHAAMLAELLLPMIRAYQS